MSKMIACYMQSAYFICELVKEKTTTTTAIAIDFTLKHEENHLIINPNQMHQQQKHVKHGHLSFKEYFFLVYSISQTIRSRQFSF